MVLRSGDVSLCSHFVKSQHLESLSVILPLSVLSEVAFEKVLNLVVKLAVQVTSVLVVYRVALDHDAVDHSEVVDVVNLLLLNSSVENLGPHLLIVPLDVVQFPSEVKVGPLIVLDLFVPEG